MTRVSRQRGCLMLFEYTGAPSVVAPMFAVAIDRPVVDSMPQRIFYKGRNIHGCDIWGLDLAGAKHMPRDVAAEAALRLEANVVAVPDWMAY